MEFIDTNVIIRFLVGDNTAQQKEAINWLQEAESGKRKIVVTPIIVAEVTFVLESFYKKNREEIADSLVVLLSQKWLDVQERSVLLSLWKFYSKGLHFVDSYLISTVQQNKGKILSFDKELKKHL